MERHRCIYANVKLHELFSLSGDDMWFCRGGHFYSVEQVQKIMREVLHVEPAHAQEFFDEFEPCDRPQ